MSFTALTAEQAQPILANFFERLRPAVLKDSEANSNMLIGWLQAKDRAATVEALLEATSALKDSLVWDIPPKRRSQSETMTGPQAKNHARPEEVKTGPTASEQAVGLLRDKQQQFALSEGERFIEGFGAGMLHSKRIAARESLRNFWEKSLGRDFTGNPTKKPTTALEALRKYGETLWK